MDQTSGERNVDRSLYTAGYPASLEFHGGTLTVKIRMSSPDAIIQDTLSLRVRYPEVDAMGYLHHSRFFQYFEMGRIELLRKLGHSYADLEREGIFFVVVKIECRYKAPARFDDELALITRVARQTQVRIDHAYELKRADILLAEATSTIACVGRDGQLQAIPEFLNRPSTGS